MQQRRCSSCAKTLGNMKSVTLFPGLGLFALEMVLYHLHQNPGSLRLLTTFQSSDTLQGRKFPRTIAAVTASQEARQMIYKIHDPMYNASCYVKLSSRSNTKSGIWDVGYRGESLSCLLPAHLYAML